VKLPPFEYASPDTVDGAVALLEERRGDATILAGGQSLVPLLALRLARPELLVDLNRIAGLDRIARVDGHVQVGATVRHAAFERDGGEAAAVPLLSRAAPLIGHFQIRNRGTLCGALTHADAAAEWPTVAVTLDAEIEIRNAGGVRWVPAREFFLGPFMTAVEPGDLVTSARFPVWSSGAGFAIEEFARRSGDFAIAGAACGIEVEDGRVSRCAIGLLGLASAPVRAETAEQAMLGAAVDELDPDEIGRLGVADTEPPTDVHASSNYRRRIAAGIVTRALVTALKEATDDC
jgi:carbon-monoxide dehydrogenase medium subunit